MFPSQTTATEKPLTWVVSPEIYPKGTLHPSNSPLTRARMTWAILLQVAVVQLREYEREHDTKEKELWYYRIQTTIQTANQLNPSGLWGYQDAPLHPTPDYLVLSVPAVTWLELLTHKLTAIFGSAIPAIIVSSPR